METYRHSGAISLLGILLATTAGIAAAVVLGVVYSFAVVYIPIVYINALLTFCFGWAMGQAVGWGAKAGKIRNPFVATAYGFLVGLIGIYVAWGTDFLARVIIPQHIQIHYISAFYPSVLMGYIKIFYEKGAWGLPHGGTVSGIPLAVVWAIEAAMIVGAATYFARKAIVHHPFCENCSRWANIEPGKRPLSLIGAGEHFSQLISGDLNALMKFNLAHSESTYLQLDLASCPTCAESCYLTIQQVSETLDKEGKLKIERKALVHNMTIPAEYIPLVQNAGLEPPESETTQEEPATDNPPETETIKTETTDYPLA
jgi:hypothetical protein